MQCDSCKLLYCTAAVPAACQLTVGSVRFATEVLRQKSVLLFMVVSSQRRCDFCDHTCCANRLVQLAQLLQVSEFLPSAVALSAGIVCRFGTRKIFGSNNDPPRFPCKVMTTRRFRFMYCISAR